MRPEQAALCPRDADSFYIPILRGQDYRAGAPSGRPDLQRRAAELLQALGPKVAGIQTRCARQYGWTANPAARFCWEAQRDAAPLTPPPLSSKCSNVVHVDLDIDAARSRLLGNGPLVFDQAHGLFEPLGRHRFRAIKLEQM